MNTLFIIGLILVGLFVLVLIITIALMLSARLSIKEITKDEMLVGGWYGGEFLMQPPLFLDLKSKNQHVQKFEKAHNKAVKVFWINLMTIILGVVFLNLGEG